MKMRYFSAGMVIFAGTLALGGCGSVPSPGLSAEASWADQRGAITTGADQRRAQRLCDTLCMGIAACHLKVIILQSERLGGWSWPDGHIYLTSALVRAVNDAELSAAIAHEMGHLVNNRNLQPPQPLARGEEHLGIESAADLTGCRILANHGIAPEALIELLQTVRNNSSDPTLRTALRQRIHFLKSNFTPSPVCPIK